MLSFSSSASKSFDDDFAYAMSGVLGLSDTTHLIVVELFVQLVESALRFEVLVLPELRGSLIGASVRRYCSLGVRHCSLAS